MRFGAGRCPVPERLPSPGGVYSRPMKLSEWGKRCSQAQQPVTHASVKQLLTHAAGRGGGGEPARGRRLPPAVRTPATSV